MIKLLPDFTRYEATRSIYTEYSELLNIFYLLLFGSLIGLPAPPSSITLRILPLASNELKYFLNKAGRIDDIISDLFDSFSLEV
jgi:hypothetical protein